MSARRRGTVGGSWRGRTPAFGAWGLLFLTACSNCHEGRPAATRTIDATWLRPAVPGVPARALPLQQLRATLGGLERAAEAWVHTGPQLRGTFPGSCGDSAALGFRYLGAAPERVPFGSGKMHRQLGLKLRARDSCNVLYVMWRFDARPGIVVLAKSNTGTHHEECGNRGYHRVRPLWSEPVEPPEPGSTHALAARLDGEAIEVWVDSRVVLRATIDSLLVPARGEAGVRSDNVRFELLGFAAVAPDVVSAGSPEQDCAALAASLD